MLTERDRDRMHGLHPDLFQMVTAAGLFCPRPFMVIEGVRTVEKQAQYVAAGTSSTMNSRHLTGHAVDLGVLDANGLLTWDWAYYHPFAVHMKGAAQLCGFPIAWGGDWQSFPDAPHWELPWDAYPVEKPLPEVREA
jgi:peptidoglycan LD-endopeptidase CwlK